MDGNFTGTSHVGPSDEMFRSEEQTVNRYLMKMITKRYLKKKKKTTNQTNTKTWQFV